MSLKKFKLYGVLIHTPMNPMNQVRQTWFIYYQKAESTMFHNLYRSMKNDNSNNFQV